MPLSLEPSTSVYGDLMNALAERLEALGLELDGQPINIKVRKKLIRTQGDPQYLLIIAPGKDGEVVYGGAWPKRTYFKYPIILALITPGNAHIEVGFQNYLGVRQKIRDETFQPALPNVSVSLEARIMPEEVVEFRAYLASQYDVSAIVAIYQTQEERVS